jgi:hypothetical protein
MLSVRLMGGSVIYVLSFLKKSRCKKICMLCKDEMMALMYMTDEEIQAYIPVPKEVFVNFNKPAKV